MKKEKAFILGRSGQIPLSTTKMDSAKANHLLKFTVKLATPAVGRRPDVPDAMGTALKAVREIQNEFPEAEIQVELNL